MARRNNQKVNDDIPHKIGGGNVNFYCMKHIGQNIMVEEVNKWNEKSILNRVDDERNMIYMNKVFTMKKYFFKTTLSDYPIVVKKRLMRLFKEQSSNFRYLQNICVCYF